MKERRTGIDRRTSIEYATTIVAQMHYALNELVISIRKTLYCLYGIVFFLVLLAAVGLFGLWLQSGGLTSLNAAIRLLK